MRVSGGGQHTDYRQQHTGQENPQDTQDYVVFSGQTNLEGENQVTGTEKHREEREAGHQQVRVKTLFGTHILPFVKATYTP